MAVATQQVRQTRTADGDIVRTTKVERDDTAGETMRTQSVVARFVWTIAGILNLLLALRFVLAVLGANPANAFANFIYALTYPFVAPFFNLFSYRLQYGISRFELYTLVAILVYTLIAYIIARLVTINQPEDTLDTY